MSPVFVCKKFSLKSRTFTISTEAKTQTNQPIDFMTYRFHFYGNIQSITLTVDGQLFFAFAKYRCHNTICVCVCVDQAKYGSILKLDR